MYNYVANCAALETRGRARPKIGQWKLPLYVNQIGCPEKEGKDNHCELPTCVTIVGYESATL